MAAVFGFTQILKVTLRIEVELMIELKVDAPHLLKKKHPLISRLHDSKRYQ